SFFQKMVAANARAAVRQEADVVVLGLGIPGWSERTNSAARQQPGGTNHPWVGSRQAPDQFEHARRLPRGTPVPPSVKKPASVEWRAVRISSPRTAVRGLGRESIPHKPSPMQRKGCF